MGQIFHLCFLILCAAFSQEMVAAFDANTEFSSVLHNRPKRMNHPPGSPSSSTSSNDLPSWFEDLKHVNIDNPTLVHIASKDSNKPGYAIHPYFVLTRRDYVLEGFRLFADMRNSRLRQPQHVRICSEDDFEEVVLIQLTNPLMLNNPRHGAYAAEHFTSLASKWAQLQVKKWILRYRPHFQEPPQESLTEMRLYDPTKVVVEFNDTEIGTGFAINPYFVVTHIHNIQFPLRVLSYPVTRGSLKLHNVKGFHGSLNVGLLRVDIPILMNFPVPAAFATANFSNHSIDFSKGIAQDWIRNFHQRAP